MHDVAAARFCGNNRQLTYDALMRFALMRCRYAVPGCNDAGNASCLKAAAARSPFLETFVAGIMQNSPDAIWGGSDQENLVFRFQTFHLLANLEDFALKAYLSLFINIHDIHRSWYIQCNFSLKVVELVWGGWRYNPLKRPIQVASIFFTQWLSKYSNSSFECTKNLVIE